MNNTNFHIVLRFSEKMVNVGDVVGKHNSMVDKYGAVWFGKVGNSLSSVRIELLNAQILQGISTNVFLIKGNRARPVSFKANLIFITRTIPLKEIKFIPEYYSEQELIDFIKTWFKLGKIMPIEIEELKTLYTLYSSSPLQQTLAYSPAGYFLVHEAQ